MINRNIGKKSAIVFLWMIFFVTIFTACEKEEKIEESNGTLKEKESEFVYQASFQKIETSLEYLADVFTRDEQIYMLGYQLEDDKTGKSICKNCLITCGIDGNDRKQWELELKESELPKYLYMDSQNQIYILTVDSVYDEEIAKEKISYNVYTIREEAMEEISQLRLQEEEIEINDFLVIEDNILLSSTIGVTVFNQKGKQKGHYNFGDYAVGIVLTQQKEIYVYGYGGRDYGWKTFDIETGKFGEFVNLCSQNIYKTENGYYTVNISEKENKLYINDTNSLHYFDIESGEFTTLFNWINYDIDAYTIDQCFPTKNGEFIVITRSSENRNKEVELVTLKKVRADSVKEKSVLKLSCIYVTDVIKKNILSFNRTNENYRIELKDYSSYEDPAVQLNLDMISGDIPDILSIDSLPVLQYIKKGVLTDLYPLMEKDEEVKKEDFIDSVINTIEKEGKLYYMGATFTVPILLSSKEIMGDTTAWTVDDMIELYDKMPEDGMFLCNNSYNMSRQLFLKNILSNQMEDYIDMSTGGVNLDSEDFIKILEFSNHFPDEKEIKENEFEIGMPTMVQTGKLMLSDWFCLKTIPDIQAYRKMYEKVGGFTVLNYPSKKEDDCLSMSVDNNTLAITEKCKDKEGAWEFVRLFLTYDYQKNNGFYNGIPTRKDALEKLLEYTMVKTAYVDEDGMSVNPVDINYLFDDYNVFVGPLSKEEVSMVESIIDRVGKCVFNDTAVDNINNIIIEEAEAFFVGDRTAKEAAQVMQNRVKIYVNEGV